MILACCLFDFERSHAQKQLKNGFHLCIPRSAFQREMCIFSWLKRAREFAATKLKLERERK